MLKKIVACISAVLTVISLAISMVFVTSYMESSVDESVFSHEFLEQAKTIDRDFKYISEKIEKLKYLYNTVDESKKDEIRNSDEYLQNMQEKYYNIQDIVNQLSSSQLSYLGISKDDGMKTIYDTIEHLKKWKAEQDDFFESFHNDASTFSSLTAQYQGGINGTNLTITSYHQQEIDLFWSEEELDSGIDEIENNLGVLEAKSGYKTYIIIASAVSAVFAVIFIADVLLIFSDKKKIKKQISSIQIKKTVSELLKGETG